MARWGFPVVALGTTLAGHLVLPRLLQMQLSDGEYVAYVAVFAIVAYLGLADGGLLLSVLREMSAAHGSRKREVFAAEAARAVKVFTGTAIGALLIALLGIGSALAAAGEQWSGAGSFAFKAAAFGVLLSTCLTIGFGSYHTAILYSTGRLLSGQIANLTTSAMPLLAMMVALIVTLDLTASLLVYAAVMGVAALGRGLHARRVHSREVSGVELGVPARRLRTVLGAGVALKVADTLPSAAFPHLLSVMAAAFVPAAIPGRTFAGGPRLIVQQFLALLQVHVTRRMAGDRPAHERGTREYRASSRFLTGLHLLQLGVAMALVMPAFRLWLPLRAEEIRLYLPGMFVEQALLSAALPSSILFMAAGRLRLLGVVKIVGVLAGLSMFMLLLPLAREAAFGIGLAVSAAPYFVAGGYCEMRRLKGFPPPDSSITLRYLLALVAAGGGLLSARHPYLSAVVVAGCGALLVPGAALDLWRMFRRPATLTGSEG